MKEYTHREELQGPDPEQLQTDPKYIRELLNRGGLTQVEAAAALGVSERTVRNWANGESRWPYTAQYTLERLVDKLDKR